MTLLVHEAKFHTPLSSKAIIVSHQTPLPGQSTHAMARCTCTARMNGLFCFVSGTDTLQVKQAALRVILNFVAAPRSLSDLLPGTGKDGQAVRGRPQRDRPQASFTGYPWSLLPNHSTRVL